MTRAAIAKNTTMNRATDVARAPDWLVNKSFQVDFISVCSPGTVTPSHLGAGGRGGGFPGSGLRRHPLSASGTKNLRTVYIEKITHKSRLVNQLGRIRGALVVGVAGGADEDVVSDIIILVKMPLDKFAALAHGFNFKGDEP